MERTVVLGVREKTATALEAARRGRSDEEEVAVCVNSAAGVCPGQSRAALPLLLVGSVCVCIQRAIIVSFEGLVY